MVPIGCYLFMSFSPFRSGNRSFSRLDHWFFPFFFLLAYTSSIPLLPSRKLACAFSRALRCDAFCGDSSPSSFPPVQIFQRITAFFGPFDGRSPFGDSKIRYPIPRSRGRLSSSLISSLPSLERCFLHGVFDVCPSGQHA